MNKSPEKIQKMFNKIAKNYDFMNRIISFGTDKFIKTKCVKLLDIKPEFKILDLCTGTGDIAGIIKKTCQQVDVIGIDFSEGMLNIARKKHPLVEFIKADCTNLPFEENSFDVVTIGFGLRNIKDYDSALKEIRRILKQNGQFMHLDFGEKTLAGKIFETIIPFLAKVFKQDFEAYKYLSQSKKDFWIPDKIIDIIENYGFKNIKRKDFILKSISCQIFKQPDFYAHP